MSMIEVAVCGAHMQGLPLNPQLLALQAIFVRATHTSADYKLYHLAGFHPPRPGLIRVNTGGSATATDISGFGGWRTYLQAQSQGQQ